MIAQVHVQGFKSLRNVRIPLTSGITVLVGANNSGKSAALQAIDLVARTFRDGANATLDDSTFESVCSRGSPVLSVRLEGTTIPAGIVLVAQRGVRAIHTVAQTSIGAMREEYATWDPVLPMLRRADRSFFDRYDAIAQTRVFDLSVPALRRSSPPEQGPALRSDGSNLGAVLDALANERPEVHDRILAEVREAAHEVKRLLAPVGRDGGGKVVAVQEADGGVYRADVLSDGLLLFIALSTIVQAYSPAVLAFEEPDRGIHPRRIKEVVDQFRRVAAKGTQIVLTTHSPLLVNEFRDAPESIVLFERSGNGTVATRLTDKPEWKDGVFSDQPLGELWYSGLLGGVPR